jgi:hypothetical protein
MTNTAPKQNLEAAEGNVSNGASREANDARHTLSALAVSEMMQKAGRTGSEAAANVVGTQGQVENGAAANKGGMISEAAGQAIEKSLGGGKVNEILKDLGTDVEKKGFGIAFKAPEVTDEDRQEAKDKLAKELGDLVPDDKKEIMGKLAGALIDGDAAKFGEVLKGLSGDPKELAKYIKVLNDNLNKNEMFGGVELSQDGKGNVLLYSEKGNTALSFDPKTGEASLKAIERQDDGSILLKPGEIINRKADEVMKGFGDQAVRSMEMPRFINKPDLPKPWPPKIPGHPGEPGNPMPKPPWGKPIQPFEPHHPIQPLDKDTLFKKLENQ